MKKQASLSKKIRFWFFSLIIIFFTILFVVFMQIYRSGLEKELTQKNNIHVSLIDSEVYGWLGKRENLLYETGVMIEAFYKDPVLAENLLDRANDYFPEILWFYFGSSNPVSQGGVYIDGDHWIPDDDWNHVERPWFIDGSKSEDVQYTDPYYDTLTNELVVSLARKVVTADNQYLGVMALDLTINALSNLIVSKTLTDSGKTYLLDKNGYFIIHENPENILKTESGDEYRLTDEYPQLLDYEKEILSQESFFVLDKKTGLYISSLRNPKTEWIFVSIGPLSDVYGTINNNLFLLAGLMLVFLLLAYLVILFIAGRISTPIKNVARLINDISSGEGDLTSELKVTSTDEVGQLSGSFNLFVSNLKGIIQRLTDISHENIEAKDSLVSSEEETSASMVEISANIKSISDQINSLDTIVGDSGKSLNLIQDSLTVLNQDIGDQTSAVEESTASITEMVASLNNVAHITDNKRDATNRLVDTAHEGGEILEQAVDSIRDVSNNINEIMDMANVIASIASQTNLLAMNAAIEAAHAGESGKGFAVVADEIRKLAESSAESSGNIQKTISGIADMIQTTVDRAGRTSEAFVNIDQEIKDVAMALSEISASTKELSIGGQEIQAAMETLNHVSTKVHDGSILINEQQDKINTGMTRMGEISTYVSGGISEIVLGAEEVVKAMSGINELSVQLADLADRMDVELSRFKTE